MFARRYFAGRYFAPRYWPESEGEAPAMVETPVVSRGGIWPENPVEPIDWRRKSAEERRRILERLILGLNEAPEDVQTEAAALVEPYAPRKKTKSVQVVNAKYKRLARDTRTVEKLIDLYAEFMAQEEEAVILLLSH